MKITPETTRHMANLAKLELSTDELERFTGELENIVNYMGMLSQLPAGAPEQIPDLRSVFRPDNAADGPDRAVLLSNAPQTDGASLIVPKTLD